MSIAVAGASGPIGRAVASHLLDAGASVTLLVRDAARVRDLVERGARARVGVLEEPTYVIDATEDADQLFWVTPLDPAREDPLAFMDDLGVNAGAAVAGNGIRRVVNLSSFGAHIPTAAGFVEGLHDNEERIDDFARDIVHLRAGFLMENYLAQVDSLRLGAVRFPVVSGQCRVPMVAGRDVAQTASQFLLHPEWSGRHVVGQLGPQDLSFDEAAGILADVLGTPVRHEPLSEEEAIRGLVAGGASDAGAALFVAVYAGLESGALAGGEERNERTTTPTTLAEFAADTLRPRV